jgi:hypothetical protein
MMQALPIQVVRFSVYALGLPTQVGIELFFIVREKKFDFL